MRVGIIDYGSGNTGSILSAFRGIGQAAILSDEKEQLIRCSHLVLPGVGSFASAKSKLSKVLGEHGLSELISSSIPFLGICVGMQLLCESGSENETTPGYGVFAGRVDSIPGASTLPHMGWNNLEARDYSNPLLTGISGEDDFYFLHSYCLVAADPAQVVATAQYGTMFPAVVQNQNVFGVQFHPEKSSLAGRKLLKNFLAI